MRRSFYDLYSLSIDDDLDNFIRKCSLLRELKYRGLTVVTCFNRVPRREELENIKERFSIMKEHAEKLGIDLISRAELKPENITHAKRILRSIRRHFDLISIPAYNRAATAFACRDSRVDIVTVVPVKRFILFKGDITYLRTQDKAIELLLSFLRKKHSLDGLAHLLGFYRDVIDTVQRKELRLVFSLGILDPQEAPDPLSLASLLCMLGLSREESLSSISINPIKKIEINRLKLSGRIPVRGVEVVDGEDTN